VAGIKRSFEVTNPCFGVAGIAKYEICTEKGGAGTNDSAAFEFADVERAYYF
jgi:hypothetical protein